MVVQKNQTRDIAVGPFYNFIRDAKWGPSQVVVASLQIFIGGGFSHKDTEISVYNRWSLAQTPIGVYNLTQHIVGGFGWFLIKTKTVRIQVVHHTNTPLQVPQGPPEGPLN